MAFSDWENFFTGTNELFTVELSQTIEGGQSLLMGQTANGGDQNALPTVASGLTQGVTAGRLRVLVDRKTPQSSSEFGIVCMQSARDVSGGSGSGYLLSFQGSGATVHLKKFTAGLGGTLTSLTSTTLSPNPPADEVFAIELMWFYDVTEFGGVKLEAKWDTGGTVTDFTGLPATPDLQAIDSSTPLSTSLGEGLYTVDLGAGAMEYIFDLATLYTVAFV